MDYQIYAERAASRFQCCKKIGNGSINFRCPYCGDSKKSPTKARAYLFCKQGFYAFKCHNCGVGATLVGFLRDHVPDLYEECTNEYKDSQTPLSATTSSMKVIKQRLGTRVTQLPPGQPGDHQKWRGSGFITPNHLYRNHHKKF
jgi:hypothetical protein